MGVTQLRIIFCRLNFKMGDDLDFRNYAKEGKINELDRLLKRGVNVNSGF